MSLLFELASLLHLLFFNASFLSLGMNVLLSRFFLSCSALVGGP